MPTAQQIKETVKLLTLNETQREVAVQVGISPATVNRIANRDDITAKIKTAQMRLINNGLQTAIQNQQLKIGLSRKILKQTADGQETHKLAKTILELGDRAETKLLESVGIHPSHTQSITLTNIMVDNSVNLSPAIEAMLTDRLGQVSEAEYDDDDLDGNC